MKINIPKLNMAIPRPASDIIFIENATISGNAIFHLLIHYHKKLNFTIKI